MTPARADDRVHVDGKHFSARGRRFAFRGVTYGTFRPREDGARFPERGPAKLDLAAMADAGFTVVRVLGPREAARVIEHLADVVRQEDPEVLVTYANYPSTEYLPLEGLDFLTFNVFLEDQEDFRRYLTRLQHLAGDRPLVLGEVGLHAGEGDRVGERRQAEVIDWQLEAALERGVAGTCLFTWTDEWWVGDAAVEGWRFGLTRAD